MFMRIILVSMCKACPQLTQVHMERMHQRVITTVQRSTTSNIGVECITVQLINLGQHGTLEKRI